MPHHPPSSYLLKNKKHISIICGFVVFLILVYSLMDTYSYYCILSSSSAKMVIQKKNPLELNEEKVEEKKISQPAPPSLPKKVFHFLKETGLSLGNMKVPLFWDDVDQQTGLLVVDVGACDGSDWSIPAVLKRNHIVLAFEPMHGNRIRFKQQIAANNLDSRVIEISAPTTTTVAAITSIVNDSSIPAKKSGHIYLFPYAVSDHVGFTTMYSSGELASIQSQDFHPDTWGFGNAKTESIPMLTLDTVISQDVHLLKIDTQGNELRVLLGARQLFTHHRVNMVTMEFWPKGMPGGDSDALKILEFMWEFGFMCFDLSSNHHIPPTRPSDFEGFVKQFSLINKVDPQASLPNDAFGLWDELLCYNTIIR